MENLGKHFVWCLRHGCSQVIFSSSEKLLVSPSRLVESPHKYRNSVVKMEGPPCHEPRDHVGDETSCANRTRHETRKKSMWFPSDAVGVERASRMTGSGTLRIVFSCLNARIACSFLEDTSMARKGIGWRSLRRCLKCVPQDRPLHERHNLTRASILPLSFRLVSACWSQSPTIEQYVTSNSLGRRTGKA